MNEIFLLYDNVWCMNIGGKLDGSSPNPAYKPNIAPSHCHLFESCQQQFNG